MRTSRSTTSIRMGADHLRTGKRNLDLRN
jgi:hypothetical protein